MNEIQSASTYISNNSFQEERKDLAAAFRWAERSNLHEAVANHFSLAVNSEGTEFLMNPNTVSYTHLTLPTKA